MRPTRTPGPTRRSAPRHALVTAGAAFAAGILAASAAATAPTALGEASPATWTVADLPGGGWVSSLRADGDGFMAVGALETDPDTYGYEARAWTSSDGRRWSEGVVSPVAGYTEMSDVTRAGPSLLAVGSGPAAIDTSDRPETRAVVWMSAEGSVWARQPDGPVFVGAEDEPGMAGMNGVASRPGSTVAVGSVASAKPAAWYSKDDGRTWTRARTFPSDVRFDGSDTDLNVSVEAVTAGGPGFVAVGYGTGAGPVAWVTSDGVDWVQVRLPWSADTACRATRIAAAPDGSLVATGYALGATPSDPHPPVVWTSPDGQSWSLADLPRPSDAEPGDEVIVAGATWDGSGWVLVGSVAKGHGTAERPGRGALWVSPDGRSWTSLPPDPAFSGTYLFAAAVAGGRLAIEGTIGDPAFGPERVWTRAAPLDPAAPTVEPQATPTPTPAPTAVPQPTATVEPQPTPTPAPAAVEPQATPPVTSAPEQPGGDGSGVPLVALAAGLVALGVPAVLRGRRRVVR